MPIAKSIRKVCSSALDALKPSKPWKGTPHTKFNERSDFSKLKRMRRFDGRVGDNVSRNAGQMRRQKFQGSPGIAYCLSVRSGRGNVELHFCACACTSPFPESSGSFLMSSKLCLTFLSPEHGRQSKTILISSAPY